MRRFRALLTLAVAVATGCSGSITAPPLTSPTIRPAHSVQHVIILLQENRSFDNLFAGFPGADTVTEGACQPAPWCTTGTIALRPITLQSTGSLGFGTDIDHSHHGFEIEYHSGKMDGFSKVRLGAAGTGLPAKRYPYSFIKRSQTKAYWDFAKQYAIADRMFFTDTASSFIAHQEIIAGTVRLNDNESLTDQPDAQPWGCDAPNGTVTAIIEKNGKVDEFGGPFPCFTQYRTMADLLDAAGTPWKYYVSAFAGKDADFSGLVWNGYDAIKKVRFGPDWKTHISEPNTNIFTDLKQGQLPAVSWVMPKLADSDHPASGCDHGPRWITSIVDSVGKSQYWDSTAIVLMWDDWGGWYDNVPPPQITYTSLGFRVPMIVISPFAKQHMVSHTQYDFGSILRFIEENFGLGSLGVSDARATSIGDMLDFTQQPTVFKPEPLPHVTSCTGSPSAEAIIDHDGGVPE